jgi:hypothetical protein
VLLALAFTEGAMAAADEALAEAAADFCEFASRACDEATDAALGALAGTFAAGAGFDTGGPAEQQSLGTTVFGAATPAIAEPNPNFCRVGASSLPVASRLCVDWNFWIAAIVLASHLPFGSPL